MFFQLQSVRALINDFKDAAFTYKAVHIFFTDSKIVFVCVSVYSILFIIASLISYWNFMKNVVLKHLGNVFINHLFSNLLCETLTVSKYILPQLVQMVSLLRLGDPELPKLSRL